MLTPGARPTATRAMLVLAVLILAGCAARPGPGILQPVALAETGARSVTVYVATTRQEVAPGQGGFGTSRASEMRFAEFEISIPPGHLPGRIEWPQDIPDPQSSFVTIGQKRHSRASFERAVAEAQRGGGETTVFVHGFNYSFQESLFRLAQIAADAEIEGVPVLFAWPSQGQVTGYVADREAATASRDGLADLLILLARNETEDQVMVFGHSLGGWLTNEAVRQLRLSGQDTTIDRLRVILAAPDIDVDVFSAQLEVIGPLSPPLLMLVAPDDRALSLSRILGQDRQRAGALSVDDPRVRAAAQRGHIQIVDISEIGATDGFNHDRYVNLAALYPQLSQSSRPGAGDNLRQAGAFIFRAVGATLSAPLVLLERAGG
ncbi:alpha/beta hydrolase [Plastorhodobacter daqingensis]|uniref:Alpha/beta hydrolase n=1 Tax=Plastorhodobacter daqingensis TaxID=1387281 RepID=A0ABW2UMK9_9RHOB